MATPERVTAAPDRATAAPETRRRAWSNWTVAGAVLWAALPVLTIGFGAWVCILLAAGRLRSRALGLAALPYLVVALVAFPLSLQPTNSAAGTATGGLAFLMMVVGTIHAVTLFGRFVRGPDLDPQRAALAALAEQGRLRARAMELARGNPKEALELRIGRVDLPPAARPFPDGGLVDMNNVPAPALAAATGIDQPTAERICTARQRSGGYGSLDELSVELDLPPKLFDGVSDRLVFLPRAGEVPSS